MYRKLYPWMFLLGGVLIGLVASGRIVLHAQDRAANPSQELPRNVRADRPEAGVSPVPEAGRAAQASVQDVLLRTYRFSFNRPTTLAQVCLHLKQTLGVPVALDVAALDRQDVDVDDTVQLELDGVRLKTGLKLLLDQVGLTYRVIPDDNLLIITDREGSDDPLDRIWSELRTLHRDLHDVQDAVDELADAFFGDEEAGPRVRKPTIIEETPERDPPAPAPAPSQADPKAARPPGQKPGKPESPGRLRGTRPTPSRVPLGGHGQPL